MNIHLGDESEHLYLQVYQHYRDLIESGALSGGQKLPSIRRCSEELHLSRTTIETAYQLLAAEGYILSKPQSGYFVTELPFSHHVENAPVTEQKKADSIRYDFSSSAIDKENFDFRIWRRYIKSALRQDERLASYGEVQGEWELRSVLAAYVAKYRNVFCTPDQIVVGAGVQSLLHILCPLLTGRQTVSFPNASFVQGSQIFHDFGFDIHYRDKDSEIIYVSPAHMTKWGDVMPVSRRLELIHYANARGSLIIEDDYENEFVYLQKPAPSLQSLASGDGVIYIGTFSKALLPSIRISFMVLTREILEPYQKVARFYNQTASKTEQIALAQFIRDGHLEAQIRKLRRTYAMRTKQLKKVLKEVFSDQLATMELEEGSIHLAVTLPASSSKEVYQRELAKEGMRVSIGDAGMEGRMKFILSSIASPVANFQNGCRILRKVWKKLN